ncbi:MAG: hypothetical protein H7326_07280 [Bdellovibrionaceae bacterium]|nr:hypothetical protein [Pseudobdellovibrionaceae bacterium]
MNMLAKSTLILCSVYMLTACSDAGMRFVHETSSASKAETDLPEAPPVLDPVTPPVVAPTPIPTPVVVAPTPVATPTPVVVVPPPVATPPPVVVVPTPVPTPPPVVEKDECKLAGVSAKACYLHKIMFLGCPLRDQHPQNYVPPTAARIVSSMDQCTEATYPTTVQTAAMSTVIQALINPNDDSFRKYIFTGLYYKPPYTEEFAKYFGIELYNAIYTFCDRYGVPPGVDSIQYNRSALDKAEWVQANKYAGQINSCVTASFETR